MSYYSLAGDDFTSDRRTEVFNVGVVSKRVEVHILDDTAIEDAETFTASLTTTEKNVVIDNGIATVSILDNDGELYLQLLSSIVGTYPFQQKGQEYFCDTLANWPAMHTHAYVIKWL